MTNNLTHVGVLGMKWGHRKGSSSSSGSEDHIRKSQLKKKKLKDMSNKEIQDLVTRINLENQYKSLNPGRIAKGKRSADQIISTIGKITLAAGTIATAAKMGYKIYSFIKSNQGRNATGMLTEFLKSNKGN